MPHAFLGLGQAGFNETKMVHESIIAWLLEIEQQEQAEQ